jgi:O-antigen ligase
VTGVTSDDVVVPSRPDTFCDVPALRREQPTAGPSLERATDQGGRSIMFAALRSTDDLASSSDARLCVATTMFYAVALVAPWHAGVAAIGFMIAIAGRRWHLPDSPSPAASAFVGVTALLAVTAFLPLLLHPVDDHGVKLLAQFCLLPVVAALCWLVPESRSLTASLWAGVTAGAVFAGAAALVQIAALDMSRAVGTEGNAIVFGDLALLMGALSVALVGPAVAWSSRLGPNAERHVALATTAAAIGGAVASLLSGSRGGWLAIAPLAALLVWNRLQASRDRGAPSAPLTVGLRNHTARAAFAAVALLAAVVIAQGMPLDRLGAGVDDITGYVTGDVADSSATAPAIDPAGTTIGARFEAWRAAADAAADHPFLGIGWGNLQPYFASQVATEGRHERIAEFTHAHQQVLGALASGGIVAVAAFAALVLVPARHFRRAARSGDPDRRAIGTAGLVVVVAFVVFGLTESILENLVPIVFYAVTVGLLSSQLRHPAHIHDPQLAKVD